MSSSDTTQSGPENLPSKVELRRELRALRSRVSSEERARRSAAAAAALVAWPHTHRARRVALFVALADEIDTSPAFEALKARGVEVVMPRVERATTSLSFAVTDDLSGLVDGPFGLKEPAGDSVELRTVDLVVVPGLAFDRWGGRLGYGVGYYDRALERFEGDIVGFCYAFQLLSQTLPQAPHDVRVTAVTTEDGLVLCEPAP